MLEGATVFALGKAALPMAKAACVAVKPSGGLVLAPEAAISDDWRAALPTLDLRPGGHPWPRADAPLHAQDFMARAASLGPEDVALCLVSGGGSAMFEWPRAELSVDTLVRDQRHLMEAGLEITALNAVRRRLSRVKGGRLAAAMGDATVLTLVVSDVPDGPASWVASGPTMCPDESAYPVAELRTRGLFDGLSPISRRLLDEPRDEVCLPSRMTHRVVADGSMAMHGLAESLRQSGLRVATRTEPVTGEAREVAGRLWPACRARVACEGVDAVIFFGETSVVVRGQGRGGRNQELVLAAFGDYDDGSYWSFGTDGVDGQSEHAGAFLDPRVVARARRLGLAPEAALDDNDSARFFEQAAGAILTGPTGTNVADVGCYIRPGVAPPDGALWRGSAGEAQARALASSA